MKKPENLKSDECFCSTDSGEELLVLTPCVETAALEAAEGFFGDSGEYPEFQEITVERGDGLIKKFKVVTEYDPTFYIEKEIL